MTAKNNITTFSQMFYPDASATSKLLTDMLVGISNNFEINVYAQNRSYTNNKVIYKASEELSHININRVNVPPLNKNNFFSRLLLSYIISKKFKQIAINIGEKTDLFLSVSNPPNMPHEIALVAKKFKVPFVYLLHDLYPDELMKTYKISNYKFAKPIVEHLKKTTFETFLMSDKIITVGRDVKSYLISNYNVESMKIEVLTNWSHKLEIDPEESRKFKTKLNLNDKFVIMYAGNIGILQDFDVILLTMKEFQLIDKDIILVVIGNGKKIKLINDFCEQNKLTNIKIVDFIFDEREYASALNAADCCLVSLNKTLYGIAVPSKTYYYLSVGKPIIGIIPKNSEIDLEIKEDDFGLTCNDYSYETLSSIILKLKNDSQLLALMSQKAKNAFETKYSMQVAIQKYLKLFKEVIEK
ncbi:MAG: glycosyltransferase family 4 protein [Nitrososphaeria archaeon]